jgi:hypothetical protein
MVEWAIGFAFGAEGCILVPPACRYGSFPLTEMPSTGAYRAIVYELEYWKAAAYWRLGGTISPNGRSETRRHHLKVTARAVSQKAHKMYCLDNVPASRYATQLCMTV